MSCFKGMKAYRCCCALQSLKHMQQCHEIINLCQKTKLLYRRQQEQQVPVSLWWRSCRQISLLALRQRLRQMVQTMMMTQRFLEEAYQKLKQRRRWSCCLAVKSSKGYRQDTQSLCPCSYFTMDSSVIDSLHAVKFRMRNIMHSSRDLNNKDA